MLITKKMLLALTLIGAVVGAGIGSLITHSASNTQAANDNYQTTRTAGVNTPEQLETTNASQYGTSAEQTAYRQGVAAGYGMCQSARSTGSSSAVTRNYTTYRAPVRGSSNNSRRVYYDYNNSTTANTTTTRPRGRSFWQKHRDKLTMAIGTGGGAAIGGMAGGKKGAGIGALVGLGSSALYTYKLRNRTRRY